MKILNDLGYSEKEVRRIVEEIDSVSEKGFAHLGYDIKKARVGPAHPALQKAIRMVKKQNPDLIVLPLRGAELFMPMLPKTLREKSITLPASETLSGKGERYEGALRERLSGKFRKVTILDDIVLAGLQAGRIAFQIKTIRPRAKVTVLALAGCPADSKVREKNRAGVIKKYRFAERGFAPTLSWLIRRYWPKMVGYSNAEIRARQSKPIAQQTRKYCRRRMRMAY